MAWRDRLQISHTKASAERVTRRYLEDINSVSCLNHLDKALDQLLDGIKDVKKIFSNYATTNPSRKPFFIYSFFQLWAAIFTLPTAPQAPRAGGKSTLLISTTNILFFLNVAQFLSGKLPDYRFNQNESLFQLDLQASTLVAHLVTTPELSVEELHKIIAAQDWFHVMLIQGEDPNVEGKSPSRLIAAFTSPPGKGCGDQRGSAPCNTSGELLWFNWSQILL
ncbi:hypothetical protein PoHVEF18_006311 [Penicillium ochrochloron]